MMTLETITIPTHKLILKDSEIFFRQGYLLAADLIDSVYDYDMDYSWCLRMSVELKENGKIDVFCGNEQQCTEKSKLLEESSVEFEISNVK